MHDMWEQKILNTSISVMIVVVNFIIKTISQLIIRMIGLHQRDHILMNIMTLIFVGQYVNTGILLVAVNANFKFTPLWWIKMENQFADYTSDWYIIVGQQIQTTMLIQAFMPYVNFLGAYAGKLVLRIIDSGLTFNNFIPKTKKKTIQAFVNLYSGPDVKLQFRYSATMIDVWVAFTHGIAIPTLFPIALVSMCNMYIVEKL